MGEARRRGTRQERCEIAIRKRRALASMTAAGLTIGVAAVVGVYALIRSVV